MSARDGDDIHSASIWISKVKNERNAGHLGPAVCVVVSRESFGILGARFSRRKT